MNEFANKQDNNHHAESEIKKNIISSSAYTNGPNSKLSLKNEYDFRGEKTKRKVKYIVEKGSIKEYYSKNIVITLNFISGPNRVNPIIYQKNKFDFSNVRSFSLQKIVQHQSTNLTNSNINYTKLDIKADPFFPEDIKLKKDFNDYVDKAIKNHKMNPLFKIDGNSCVVNDKNCIFGNNGVKKRDGNLVINKLWESYIGKSNVKIGNMETPELSLFKPIY